jgi:hypothetical protein
VSVQDGKFRRLRLASGTLKGTLSVEHVVLVDRSSKEHELPGEISFGDGGFPIGVVARNDATPSLPAPPAVRAEAAQR